MNREQYERQQLAERHRAYLMAMEPIYKHAATIMAMRPMPSLLVFKNGRMETVYDEETKRILAGYQAIANDVARAFGFVPP